MNKLWVIPLLGILAAAGCTGKGTKGGAADPSLDKDSSYALGMNVGSSLKQGGVRPDYEAFARGLQDVLEDKETRFSQEEAAEKLQAALVSAREKQDEVRRQAEADFFGETGKRPGLTRTESGLWYEVIAEGTGAKPGPADTVRVNYEGTFTDGTVFDSSYPRGEPAEFSLSAVIPGWAEGIQLMSEGAQYKLYVPSDLGYGPGGFMSIPPYSPLIFEVELLSIVK
jgi:FKBP-type peptidyl-prolyl cis-trans isomerase